MYEEKTFIDKVKSIDFYRKLPKGYLQPTVMGACLTLCTFALTIYLIVFEFSRYFDVQSSSQMLVDVSKGSEKLKINIDLIVNSLPCSILTMAIEDKIGSMPNQYNSIIKKRINANGKVIESNIPLTKVSDNPMTNDSYAKVKEELMSKEGCAISGTFMVNRVPGNFYITSKHHEEYINQYIRESNGSYYIDMTHTITHLSFGEKTDIDYIKKHFYNGIFNPLDNISKKDTNKNNIFDYYLNVVPTTYKDLNNKEYNVNQFTANNNIVHEHSVYPAIFFQYDMSPILVYYSLSQPSMFRAIVNVFAIFGGIFTISGIIDSILHSFTKKIIKKD